MKSFKDFNESGLWDNIRKKRARGEPMRKKGEKGAPTAAAMAKAKGEANESTKAYGDTLRKIANDRKLKSLSKKDKDTLAKIADMLSKANEEVSLDESINVKKALAKVKGITKQQTQMFMSLPTPLLQNIIQQLSALTMSNEEVNEAPYVAGEMDIIDSMWNEIRNKMFKDKRNKKIHYIHNSCTFMVFQFHHLPITSLIFQDII